MKTPIADFVKEYEQQNIERLHMPGHKGKSFLGCEAWDITEIKGADALYEADGIIAESEANASSLFGTARTVYSTEGSSQCIRGMLNLAMTNRKSQGKPVVVAARNVHKAFVYAAALLDLDVVWLFPEKMNSLCSCDISMDSLENVLKELKEEPIAVYVTSPDYLGSQLDIRGLAEVCHKYGTILAVDNAHGSYLHFLKEKKHPIDLGADICCDSAHKTLPVLTGGAYLQISKNAPENFVKYAKSAMALFGSTSPSYLTLCSLDLCNRYLAEDYEAQLEKTIVRLDDLKDRLRKQNWKVEGTEPLKLTVRMPEGRTGYEMAEILRQKNLECEFADPDHVVCMFTPEISEETYKIIVEVFGENQFSYTETQLNVVECEKELSIREAIFSAHEEISVEDAIGRICASPTVSCPPAIPIVVSGEIINEDAIKLFKYYGVQVVDVVV